MNYPLSKPIIALLDNYYYPEEMFLYKFDVDIVKMILDCNNYKRAMRRLKYIYLPRMKQIEVSEVDDEHSKESSPVTKLGFLNMSAVHKKDTYNSQRNIELLNALCDHFRKFCTAFINTFVMKTKEKDKERNENIRTICKLAIREMLWKHP